MMPCVHAYSASIISCVGSMIVSNQLREAREAEKQLVSRNNSIVDRLPGIDIAPQLPAPEEKTEYYRDLTDEEYFNMVAHFDEYE